jgi:hypothetical protein
MNIDQIQRKDIVRIMNWCKSNIGINHRRHTLPLLEYHSKRGQYGDCGEYDFEDNIITVYKGSHKSVLNLIHTIIHEWCHYKQSKVKYYKFDEEFGYFDNPLEIQANEIAELNKFQCKRDIFR